MLARAASLSHLRFFVVTWCSSCCLELELEETKHAHATRRGKRSNGLDYAFGVQSSCIFYSIFFPLLMWLLCSFLLFVFSSYVCSTKQRMSSSETFSRREFHETNTSPCSTRRYFRIIDISVYCKKVWYVFVVKQRLSSVQLIMTMMMIMMIMIIIIILFYTRYYTIIRVDISQILERWNNCLSFLGIISLLESFWHYISETSGTKGWCILYVA